MSKPLTRVSIELVPRDINSLRQDLADITRHFNGVKTINIPDLLRFELRSWEGCYLAKEYVPQAIPHMRAIDIDLNKPLPMAAGLIKNNICEILIITGDRPQEMSRPIFPTTTVEAIRKFKQELPNIKIYAAFDPYRTGFRQERDYVLRKLEAGADGFFTQPFFDLRLMAISAEILENLEIFWGVSPVTSVQSRTYWETRNNVIFPRHFLPTLEWNREFGAQALDFARKTRTNIYFMPIRANPIQYLQGILL